MNTDGRSILDCSIDELETILSTNELPHGVDLRGIEKRNDFDKLFKHRGTPKYIATTLLRERVKTTVQREPTELKEKRIAIKEMELNIRAKRAEGMTFSLDRIYSRLSAIETQLTALIKQSAHMNEVLFAIESNTQRPAPQTLASTEPTP